MVGRVYALLAGVGFGTLGMFSKLFYEHGGHPFELMLTKFVGAALVLGAISATRRSTLRNRGLILFGVGLGAFQLLANYGLLEGFDRAPAALVVLLFYVYPLIVTLAAVPIFGEPLGARRLAALAVGLCGVALTVGTPSSVPAMGVVLALGAALTTVGYVLGARHVMRESIDGFHVSALMTAGPAVVLLLVGAGRGIDVPPGEAIGWALGSTFVSTALAMSFFYAAVKRIGPALSSLIATIEPLVGVLLAYLVLDESLEPLQLVGGALIVASVTMLTVPARRRRAGAPVGAPV